MTVAVDKLTSVDLDELQELDAVGLREHFLALASGASEGQLRSVLGLPLADQRELKALAELYADRHLAAALRLRSLAAGADSGK